MGIIEQYVKENSLNKENVLRLVDEYTLYAHYLDFAPELSIRYKSPIRHKDDYASFTLFPSNNSFYEYLWKDHAMNVSGSIFKLIGYLIDSHNLNDILTHINTEFDLGLGTTKVNDTKIIKYDRPQQREETVIKVRTRDWNEEDRVYWSIQGISIDTLKRHNVFPITCFWTNEEQTYPIFPKGLCYAYAIGDKFKIYQPFNPDYKFITNYPNTFIEGFIQLDWEDGKLLVITKSMKEVMWFRENMRLNAVAGKSESTIIPVEYINLFKQKFRRIIVFLDPDRAGYKQAYKYQELYGFDWVTLYPCMLTGAKDPTDCNKLHGLEYTKNVVSKLISC